MAQRGNYDTIVGMTTKNICVFGDSIAYGAWSRDRGWVDRFRVALQRRTVDSGFQEYYFLYNQSIPGNTTEDVLRRFAAECSARDPHIIVFAVGINDASSRGARDAPRVAPARFEENMRGLLGVPTLRRDAETVVVIGLTRVNEKFTTPFENTYFFNERIAAYDAAMKKICEALSAQYLDVSRLLQPEDLQDGLHPNDQGHEKIFRAAHDFLAPFLVEK